MHPAGKPTYTSFAGPGELSIHHYGPPFESGPLPALFYFALIGEESMTLDPYNQPVLFFGSEKTRVFSFTLPGHGPGFNNLETMQFWAEALQHHPQLFEDFFLEVIRNIHYLVAEGWVDADRLAVAGLSRGGFIATHLAGREPLLKNLVAFAPLTRLGVLEEFQRMVQHPLDLILLAEKLAGKRIRFYIGNRDQRVGTRDCMECILAFTEASYLGGERSPPVELIVSPSIGHKGHGTGRSIFEDGAQWMKVKVEVKDEMG
jgi:pimeloyl-ACP methyl ester carboxylesterase